MENTDRPQTTSATKHMSLLRVIISALHAYVIVSYISGLCSLLCVSALVNNVIDGFKQS